MSTRVRNLASVDFGADRKAPAEIQLWRVGENPTDYGIHIWNERSVELAYGEYQKRGNLLGIDVEHGKSQEALAERVTDEPPRMAGYAALEIREGAPWLVFQWSDYGRQQIESGERRYLSPEYYTDPDTKEIVSIMRISLVAEPGTHMAKLLCSKAQNQKFGIIPTETSRLPKAASKKTKAARMNDKDLALAGAVMLALQAIVDGAEDEGVKQWAQATLDQITETLGDMAQKAMELAQEQPEPASGPVETAATEEKDKEAAMVASIEADKKTASRLDQVETSLKSLASKLDAVLTKVGAAKPWIAAGSKTRTPAPDATYGLSAEELVRCKENNWKPEKYAASKARMVR